jgi:hypothetical protein
VTSPRLTTVTPDGNRLTCTGCGASVALPRPLMADAYLPMRRAFDAEHARCAGGAAARSSNASTSK